MVVKKEPQRTTAQKSTTCTQTTYVPTYSSMILPTYPVTSTSRYRGHTAVTEQTRRGGRSPSSRVSSCRCFLALHIIDANSEPEFRPTSRLPLLLQLALRRLLSLFASLVPCAKQLQTCIAELTERLLRRTAPSRWARLGGDFPRHKTYELAHHQEQS